MASEFKDLTNKVGNAIHELYEYTNKGNNCTTEEQNENAKDLFLSFYKKFEEK